MKKAFCKARLQNSSTIKASNNKLERQKDLLTRLKCPKLDKSFIKKSIKISHVLQGGKSKFDQDNPNSSSPPQG